MRRISRRSCCRTSHVALSVGCGLPPGSGGYTLRSASMQVGCCMQLHADGKCAWAHGCPPQTNLPARRGTREHAACKPIACDGLRSTALGGAGTALGRLGAAARERRVRHRVQSAQQARRPAVRGQEGSTPAVPYRGRPGPGRAAPCGATQHVMPTRTAQSRALTRRTGTRCLAAAKERAALRYGHCVPRVPASESRRRCGPFSAPIITTLRGRCNVQRCNVFFGNRTSPAQREKRVGSAWKAQRVDNAAARGDDHTRPLWRRSCWSRRRMHAAGPSARQR